MELGLASKPSAAIASSTMLQERNLAPYIDQSSRQMSLSDEYMHVCVLGAPLHALQSGPASQSSLCRCAEPHARKALCWILCSAVPVLTVYRTVQQRGLFLFILQLSPMNYVAGLASNPFLFSVLSSHP